MIYRGKSGKTGKKSEILESKYPMYAWRKRTLARRLLYFDIKFTNYEVDIEDVKEAVRCEMELLSYLIYKVQITFQQGVNSEKHPQTKCMI